MKLFDIFRRKKKEPVTPPRETKLPGDLERFRMRRGPMPAPEPMAPPSPYGPVPEERAAPMPPRPMLPEAAPGPREETTDSEKIDIILQRLETIDTRLKLIEERTKR